MDETARTEQPPTPRGVRRRDVLVGGGGAALGALATWAGLRVDVPADSGAAPSDAASDSGATATTAYRGDLTEPWQGEHQAGIVTPAQGFATLTAYDLRDGVDALRLERLMRIWTDDVSRLAEGRPGLTDTEPELAAHPARLTITVGLGPGAFDRTGLEAQRPAWLAPLPPYSIDALEDAWTGGDLMVQACGEDPSTVAHAARYLAKEAADFASVRWAQHGFRNAAGQVPASMTFRNQFGQLDGSSNLQGEEGEHVWITDDAPAWLRGGTTMVVRRIHMNLDKWDELDRVGREVIVGRRLGDGAPLTGGDEFTPPDLEAVNELGFPAIDAAAHIRRARTGDPTQRILRRPYSYEAAPSVIPSDTGQIFIAFQADLEHQFLPVQARLAELDLLNQWTTPIGSAVFAIPRGVREGEFLAQDLFA
jgi:dye decolorizing peroxidase